MWKYCIYYISRTHSQLENVISELKKICYQPITSILASRDQMCLNKSLEKYKGNNLNIKCTELIKNNGCPYFNNKNNTINMNENYNKNLFFPSKI